MTEAELDELDRRVAEIEGWHKSRGARWWRHPHRIAMLQKPPSYTRDPSWWGPLLEKYQIAVEPWRTDDGWIAYFWGSPHVSEAGDTPAIAICRAIIAREEARHD